ncbi:hypothetical protein M413DRAFT_12618 [Hebeloma cylindrosporum]|uniref:Uncharacterized protein n=1 Tax=Hebeloma cylindrosporum TaxID=76867 RepID=A0A0C3BPZ5_HEBCY|nr:hypothetical protein M413DRAFT_12618 [Hebeloma cylindrosporum h7]
MPKSAKKRNTAQTQPPPPPPPLPSLSSAPPPPSPAATTVNDGPEPPAPTIVIDFAVFVRRASLLDLEKFLELAATTREGRNLKLLWDRAFLSGMKTGIEEASKAVDYEKRLAFATGYNQGLKAPASKQCTERIEEALELERASWIEQGHGDNCFKLPISPSTREFAVQSDPICLSPMTPSLTCEVAVQSDPIHFPSTASSSTQTSLTPPASSMSAATLPNLSSQPPLIELEQPKLQVCPEKLNWADDVATSPSSFIPSTAPRDLSCLRSESIHPFGALRQRDCRTRRQPRKHRNRTMYISSYPRSRSAHIPPISSFTIPRNPPYLSPSHFPPSPPLNWEDDPRLLALSRALRALGWNRDVS